MSKEETPRREIKFRAWSKAENRMFGWSKLIRLLRLPLAILDENYQQSDLVLMQYSNLTDNSGYEIYEGDIIRRTVKNRVQTKPVVFDESFGCFTLEGEITDWQLSLSLPVTDEIIGNIYENPELLEEVEQ